jgi:hypothetical protein
VGEAELAGRTLIASVEIGPGGRYSIEIGSDGYDGGPVEVDLYCGTVPRPKIYPRAGPGSSRSRRCSRGWRPTYQDLVAAWDYCIPRRFWCYILSLFGVWPICGRLRTCDEGTPIPGATVSAFDVDWLQDDPLGAATTDGTGHFLITYFTRTPFSPALNVELVGGPDVYFAARRRPPVRGRGRSLEAAQRAARRSVRTAGSPPS